MDRPRQQPPRRGWRRYPLWLALAAGALAGWPLVSTGWKPAGYPVARASIAIGTVSTGALDVRVHGNGVLLPVTSVLVAAQVEGRIERILARPGSTVRSGETMLELSHPALLQAAEESRWALEAQLAELNALRVSLASERLNQEGAVVKARFAHDSAKLQLDAETRLLQSEGQIIRAIDYQRSQLNVKQLAESLRIETDRLARLEQNTQARLLAEEARVEQLRRQLRRAEQQVEALTVRSPMDGIVQSLGVEPGQQVQAGGALAKIADPAELYAELKIPEQQARDLALGQPSRIDTRNGLVDGTVVRIDPAVVGGMVRVDVRLAGTLPRGARPDLSVEGQIAVAALADALQVPRPAQIQSGQRGAVYRLLDEEHAERIAVEFGLASVNRIEVKSGLKPGDRIVLNDTTLWGEPARIELR